MRILHLFDHSIPLHSGYTFRSRAILQEQRRLGWMTDHVTSPKHNLARLDQAGGVSPVEDVEDFRFYRASPAKGLLGRLPVVNQYAIMRASERRLREVVDIVKPDLIQAHSPALNAIPAIKVGRRCGIPVVYEIRAFWEDAAVSHNTSQAGGLRYRLTRSLETRALRQVDAVTCICEGIRGDIVERGIPTEKVTLIPNAVDVDRFLPIPARDADLAAKLGIAEKPVIGFIGSFYAYEGLDLLLDATPELMKDLADIQVVLVGGGPMEGALREQARKLGIAERVHFTGRVPHDEVSRYYSLVDIQVYPRHSMRITELVTPLKPLEAMAQQCIFIASDVGGHRELIRDGETGVLFRKDDVADLTSKLVGMFANRGDWSALRTAGRRFVEQERTWEASVANYKPVYERLIASYTSRG